MSSILFVKTSSLGDVVHMMPAVSDARRAMPNAHLAWIVDEAYAPLVRLHGAVDEVLTVAWRRWRRRLHHPSAWREMTAFRRDVGTIPYDAVVDTQGLMHSALMARLARGKRHGYDALSVREPAAAALYDQRHSISRRLHAIERNRILTGAALRYEVAGPPDYGLARPKHLMRRAPYAVLVHATSRTEKSWPELSWVAIGHALSQRGLEIVLPSGSPADRLQTLRIAGGLRGAATPEVMPVDRVTRLIAGASLLVGVDTGLLHLGVALGVPTVAIFTASEPALTGPLGHGPIEIVGAKGRVAAPDKVLAAVDRILVEPPAQLRVGVR